MRSDKIVMCGEMWWMHDESLMIYVLEPFSYTYCTVYILFPLSCFPADRTVTARYYCRGGGCECLVVDPSSSDVSYFLHTEDVFCGHLTQRQETGGNQ